MKPRILLVPSVSKGNGSGHIVRCLGLARELAGAAAVFIPEAKSESAWSAAELSMAYARELSGVELVTSLREDLTRSRGGYRLSWDLIVLDRRSTAREELAFWERLGPVVAIDEGGEARSSVHYLIDILPRSKRGSGAGKPNRSGLCFLDLPRHRRAPPRDFRRILISFGGEDPAGLSVSFARELIGSGIFVPEALTIVSGALRCGAPPSGLEGATILGPVQDLKEHLASYDLVLTQFGLTAFEAASAGCGVILLNPSAYHRELARTAGFPEVGVERADFESFRKLISAPSELLSRTAALIPEETESLAAYLASLAPAGPSDCPICGSDERRVLHRDASKSVFRCAECGIVYAFRLAPGRDDPYKASYFFEEYRNQYGKTYLEDWPALSRLAYLRMDLIEFLAQESLGRAKGLSILDVGCAYGPFLAEARDRGHTPYGLDAAPEAAAYVRENLGIPATAGDFLDPAMASSPGKPYDVITMWYVVEHFADLSLALFRAASLLRPGGILALSTPSGEGASALFDREGFFTHSPLDHFTIWEPSRVRGLLGAFGFHVDMIRVTGHHPERLPLLRTLARAAGRTGTHLSPPIAVLGKAVSRIFGLGDTFEIYARREVNPIPKLESKSSLRGAGAAGSRPSANNRFSGGGRRRGAGKAEL